MRFDKIAALALLVKDGTAIMVVSVDRGGEFPRDNTWHSMSEIEDDSLLPMG
jgi:hypothetical protein